MKVKLQHFANKSLLLLKLMLKATPKQENDVTSAEIKLFKALLDCSEQQETSRHFQISNHISTFNMGGRLGWPPY